MKTLEWIENTERERKNNKLNSNFIVFIIILFSSLGLKYILQLKNIFNTDNILVVLLNTFSHKMCAARR